MQQTLHSRYTHLRKRGLSAHAALRRARRLNKRIHTVEPFIGPPFPFDRNRGQVSADDQYRWIEHVSDLGWRSAGFADQILGLRHQGWYADSLYDEVYRGIVYRLPGGRFVPGYADPINHGCALLANWTAHDQKEAARSADRIAERFAERNRAHDEAWHCVRRAVEERRDARAAVIDAIGDLRELETCDSPRIRTTITTAFERAWSRYRKTCESLRDALDHSAPFHIKASEF